MDNNKPTVKLKTIQLEYKGNQTNILNNMMLISKNIYNCCIYTNNIFSLFKNEVFKHIYNDILNIKNKYKKTYKKKIKNYDVMEQFTKLFDNYYVLYTNNKQLIKNNNYLLFNFIKNKINSNNIVLNNNNVKQFIIDITNDTLNLEFNNENKFIVFDSLIIKIVKYFYDKFYITTKNELINHKPLTYNNNELINDVKNNNYYFIDTTINYKIKLIDEFEFKLDSDQHIFKNTLYDYYLGDNKQKLPADITLNIINKYYEAIKSYYAKIQIGMKSNKPKYLDKNSKFGLFYYPSSFKNINKFLVRLTTGEYHADNFNNFQNKKLNKITNRKYYNNNNIIKTKKHLKKNQKKNFIKVEDGYINKKQIIDAYYIYFKLPPILRKNKNKINLIQLKSYGNKIFINITYEELIEIPKIKGTMTFKNSISIDPGIKNLLTIYNPTGTQHIIKGNIIKSINEFYNKKISELQSINKKLHNKNTFNRLYSLLNERNRKINAEINSLIKLLIETYPDKKYFIIGYNEKWKNTVSLGKKLIEYSMIYLIEE